MYLQDKENLEIVISKMEEEDRDVKDAAFELLIIYLYTPKDLKSDEVNKTLIKNWDKLTSIIETDLDETKQEGDLKQRKEAIEWLSRIQMNL